MVFGYRVTEGDHQWICDMGIIRFDIAQLHMRRFRAVATLLLYSNSTRIQINSKSLSSLLVVGREEIMNVIRLARLKGWFCIQILS